MSRTEVFLDTNVLVHLFDSDAAKADRAEAIIEAGVTISVQVLNEFVVVARRKLKRSWPEIREMLAGIRPNCDVVPVTLDVHEKGLAYAEQYQLSLYDAMIVAAASLAGCSTLFSEDMHDGLVINGLTIRNPYNVD